MQIIILLRVVVGLLLVRKALIARKCILEFDISLAIATAGWRTSPLPSTPDFGKPRWGILQGGIL